MTKPYKGWKEDLESSLQKMLQFEKEDAQELERLKALGKDTTCEEKRLKMLRYHIRGIKQKLAELQALTGEK